MVVESTTSECFYWPDQPSKCDVIMVLQYTFAAISLACLLFVITTIVLFKLYKLFVQRLILFLCLSAAVKSSLQFVDIYSVGKTGCIMQAFFSQFCAWAELLWVCAITSNIVMVIHGYKPEKYEVKTHLFVWLFALFWSLVPINYYGEAGNWCWIERQYTTVRFGVWYVPFIIILVMMIATYIYLFCYALGCGFVDEISGTDFEMEQVRTQRKKEVMPLMFYPVIYLFLNMPMLVYRIEDAMYPGEPPIFVLLVLSIITVPLIGAFNALVFAVLEDTLRESCTVASIKAALTACCFGELARVTHNYEVIDEGSGSSNGAVSPTIENVPNTTKPMTRSAHNRTTAQEIV